MEALLSSFAAKKQDEVEQVVHDLQQANTAAAARLSARSAELHEAAKSAQDSLKASVASSTCWTFAKKQDWQVPSQIHQTPVRNGGMATNRSWLTWRMCLRKLGSFVLAECK